MKKLLFVAFLATAAFGIKAQGNLQFNQVLNFSYGSSYSTPQGKVLKIESINFNSPVIISPLTNCITGSQTQCIYQSLNYLVLGDIIFSSNTIYSYTNGGCINCPQTNSTSTTSSTFNLPIWLPAGKTVSVLAEGIHISAIEFNIVP